MGNTSYSELTTAEQARRAWSIAIPMLVKYGGMSDRQARSFFGKLLSRNKLTGDQMLQAVLRAEILGTEDPAPYFIRAAAGVRSRSTDPGMLAAWT